MTADKQLAMFIAGKLVEGFSICRVVGTRRVYRISTRRRGGMLLPERIEHVDPVSIEEIAKLIEPLLQRANVCEAQPMNQNREEP